MTRSQWYWLIHTIVWAWAIAYVAWRHDPVLGVFGIMVGLLATVLGLFAWHVGREGKCKRG